MTEIWKDVVGFEGIYQVSNLGNVKSVDREIVHKNGTKVIRKGVERALFKDHRGYLRVILSKHCKQSVCRVHRLVANAFIGNEENKAQVNHIDCDKTNNRVENLEWCTAEENMVHAVDNGLLVSLPDRKHRGKWLKQTNFNGDLVGEYPSAAEAERQTGINHSNILKAVKKQREHAGGFLWELRD